MATENWSPVYVLENLATDIATAFETSAFGTVAFGVVSFGGTPDVGKEVWSAISATGTAESWSAISATGTGESWSEISAAQEIIMAITQAICDSFKEELLEGTHDLDGHTLKMALYTSSATLGSTTTAYSTTNESSGTNYTAGGATITSVTVAKSTSTTYVDFADVSWSSATISDAAGALIYNSSQSNKAIAVIDFGATKSVTSGTLTVTLPANSAAAAIIRLK